MVTLRSQNNLTIVPDVSMLLDSGADVSLVPETVVRSLTFHLMTIDLSKKRTMGNPSRFASGFFICHGSK